MCFIFHPLEFNRRHFLLSPPYCLPLFLSWLLVDFLIFLQPYLRTMKMYLLITAGSSIVHRCVPHKITLKQNHFYSSRKTNIIYLIFIRITFYARRNFQQIFSAECERTQSRIQLYQFLLLLGSLWSFVFAIWQHSDWNIFLYIPFSVWRIWFRLTKKSHLPKRKTQIGLCKRKVTWLHYERKKSVRAF